MLIIWLIAGLFIVSCVVSIRRKQRWQAIACGLLATLSLVGAIAVGIDEHGNPGSRSTGNIRGQIRVGMGIGDVLRTASPWFWCRAHPDPRPSPDARIQVTSTNLVISGFGGADGTVEYANQAEMTAAVTKVMQSHPGRWTFTLGYIAVPTREYFDVVFDKDQKVASVSAIRPGLD